MTRPRPVEQIDICLSYRVHAHAGACCYVTAIVMRTDGTRQVHDSRHLSGDPIQIVDRALALAREQSLEEFLPLTEPF